jgi:O-acetyl-ADP-ribose deacetylase (regulator of RNase III)
MKEVVNDVAAIIKRHESENTANIQSAGFRLNTKITKAAFGKVGEVVGEKLGAYVKGEAGQRIVAELAKKVGSTSVAYGAIGIGAIGVCLLLDTIMSLIGGRPLDPQSIAEILRTVFKDEQAKRIHDLVDYGFERLHMFALASKEKQVTELSKVEADLHSALVTVKNSMLVENKWELRYIHAWVHGTFIHALLVLHLAKLNPRHYPGTTVTTVLDNAVLNLRAVHSAWLDSRAPQYDIRIHNGAGGPWVHSGPSVTIYKHRQKLGHANGRSNGGYGVFLSLDDHKALLRPMLCEYFAEGIEETMACFEQLRSNPAVIRDAGSFRVDAFIDQLRR